MLKSRVQSPESRVGRRYVTGNIIVCLSTPNCFWLHLIICYRHRHSVIVIVIVMAVAVMAKASPPPRRGSRGVLRLGRAVCSVSHLALVVSPQHFHSAWALLHHKKGFSRFFPLSLLRSPGYCALSEAEFRARARARVRGYLFARRPSVGCLLAFFALFQFGGMKNFIGIGFYCGAPLWWISFFGRYKLCDANGACGRAGGGLPSSRDMGLGIQVALELRD